MGMIMRQSPEQREALRKLVYDRTDEAIERARRAYFGDFSIPEGERANPGDKK